MACLLFLLTQGSSQSRPSTHKHYALFGVIFGCLGALDQVLLALYLWSTYQPLSVIPLMSEMALPVHLGTIALFASALLLVYGSLLMQRRSTMKGGWVNLLAGTLVPIPTYVYFAFFSQLTLLNWLGPSGFLLLVPAVMSGVVGIFAAQSLHPD